MQTPTRRLHIDRTRCEGHGLCAALLPRRLPLDEWGFPILEHPDVRTDDLDSTDGIVAVRRAVATCPALALRLTAEHRS
jgi:ferredoxin